jgi:hypothetical protein
MNSPMLIPSPRNTSIEIDEMRSSISGAYTRTAAVSTCLSTSVASK